jgi:hypothetical protein
MRIVRLVLVSTVGMIAGAALVAAQRAPGGSDSRQEAAGPSREVIVIAPSETGDIVTIAGRAVLRGGLWRFTRGGMLSAGSTSLPYKFSMCLPTEDLEGVLRLAANERSNLPTDDFDSAVEGRGATLRRTSCGTLRLKLAKGDVSGRRSCSLISQQIGQSHSSLTQYVTGRYDSKDLVVTNRAEEQTVGIEEAGRSPVGRSWRWRVTAERVGECPAKPAGDQLSLARGASRIFSLSAVNPPL